MALGTGLSFRYWDTTANTVKRIAVDDGAAANVGRFKQLQARELYTGSNGSLNITSQDTDDVLAAFNDDGTVTIGVSGQDTTIAGNLVVTGDVIVNGTSTTVNSTVVAIDDNIIFVNSGPSASKNAGYATERYQSANQAGTGDVVGDTACLVVSISDIGDQTGQDSTHIYLDGGSATNDYYTGMWIKTHVDNNVRKITAYNGTSKIATVATAWTNQPANNAAVSIYTPFQGLLWNETDNRFVAARTAGPAASDVILDHVDFSVGVLRADDGIYSSNGIILNNGTAANNIIKSSGGDLILSGGMGMGGLSLRTNNGGAANGVDISSSNVTSHLNIIPSSDSSKNIGSSSAAFATAYVDTLTSLDANGYIQIGSNTVALRLPNLDDTAVGALAAVAAGALVWNTTDTELQVYDGSAWVAVGGGAVDTTGITGTTSLTYTINNDEDGAVDQDAALVLKSGDGSSNVDTGTLTYVYGGDGSNLGTWLFSAAVKLADDKSLVLGSDADVDITFVSGTSLFDINVSGSLELDVTQAIYIESSSGTINIGADDVDQAINIGTNGERALTLGSTNGAAGLVFNAGTGFIDINATVKFSFAADFCFDGFTVDGGLATGEFAYISANNTLAEATAADGGHCADIQGVYNGTGLVVSGPVTIKKPSGETWVANDRLFVSTAGGATNVAPSSTDEDVREIGRVINGANSASTSARIMLDLTKDTMTNP